MQTQVANKKDGILFYLLVLTSFFILLEISFFIQCNRVYLSDYTFVSDTLNIPITIIPGILYFIFMQLCIHVAYCLIVWIMAGLITSQFLYLSERKFEFSISLWMWGVLTAVTANQFYFPNSKFSKLTEMILFNSTLTQIVLIILLGGCVLSVTLAVIGLSKRIGRRFIYFGILTTSIISAYLFLVPPRNSHLVGTNNQYPNIILIGVDSLRPDFLSYFGRENSTPYFDSFLKKSLVFTEAVTPLARTFPSWTGILTGQYPRETHVRSNLASQQNLLLNDTLPAILKRHGYETVYATDETRFSNIDKNFGFQKIITPPMGLNDFLIGNFNDFPFSNLLINTFAGKWLFPYSYANRAVAFAYNPNSFLDLITPIITAYQNKPLFFAVHFCLPHFPYSWAEFSEKDIPMKDRYVKSIQRVDLQVRDFLNLLERNHLLDKAIVVLLSDHGEALELSGDRVTAENLFVSSHQLKPPRFYPPSLDDEKLNQSAGHGTDVLGLPQYRTVLAFRFFGVYHSIPRKIKGNVSLLDIKSTLLDLVHISSPKSSGISLVNSMVDQTVLLRHIFMESDFSPQAIRTVYPNVREALHEGIDLFQINPVNTRLILKDSMNLKIIKSKQYADLYGDWILALYPQSSQMRMPILVNLRNGKWTNDLQSSFALQSPAKQMLEQLHQFYGDEII